MEVNDVITAFYCSKVTKLEADLLGQQIGECTSQQTFEALAVLVALRAWCAVWRSQRVQLRVRSDSMSSLIIVLKLTTAGHGPGIIAREIALDIAESVYRPDVSEHVPGIANCICDELSRLHQPGASYKFPTTLIGVKETVVPLRTLSYFRTLPQK